jgi:hypothetical protein
MSKCQNPLSPIKLSKQTGDVLLYCQTDTKLVVKLLKKLKRKATNTDDTRRTPVEIQFSEILLLTVEFN